MKNEKDVISKENILTDEQLEQVTGGLSTSYRYWFAGDGSDPNHCPDGSPHQWVLSPNGNFEYCKKCDAERYLT